MSKYKIFNTNLTEKPCICLLCLICCLFIIFVVSSSSVKNFGSPSVFVRYLVEKNVSESDRDVRERDDRGREEFS